MLNILILTLIWLLKLAQRKSCKWVNQDGVHKAEVHNMSCHNVLKAPAFVCLLSWSFHQIQVEDLLWSSQYTIQLSILQKSAG